MLTNDEYKGLDCRVLVDIDNERSYDHNILGLSQTDEIVDFKGNKITFKMGDYLYTYTELYEDEDVIFLKNGVDVYFNEINNERVIQKITTRSDISREFVRKTLKLKRMES